MKDEHTYFEKMARIDSNTVIYKGTFVSNQSLCTDVGRTATNEHMPNIAHDAQNVITIGKYLDYLGYRLSIDTSNRYM